MTKSVEYEKIESLQPDFQYVDGDNDDRVVVTVGFLATFYFGGGHRTEKRLALADCFDAFLANYGSNLGWFRDPETWQAVSLSKRPLPSLRDSIQGLDEDDAIGWYFASGSDPDAVSDFAISCMTERGWQDRHISCLQMQFPRSEVFDEEKRSVLESLLKLCADRLAPLHGSAGLAIVTIEQALTWQPEVLDLATRYRGAQIEDIVTDRRQALNGPKGINWITFVGDALTERLGGPPAFSTYCQRFGVTPTRSSNGFIIRAGNLPQLAPTNEPPPAPYAQVNAAIRPLRNGNYDSMGSGSVNGELRFNRCVSDLWIRRFDGPHIWPPSSFAGLVGGPIGKAPDKVIKLKTGDICAVHGRYRPHPIKTLPDDDEDQEIPTVVLVPGDVAPYLLTPGAHGEFPKRDAITWALAAEL